VPDPADYLSESAESFLHYIPVHSVLCSLAYNPQSCPTEFSQKSAPYPCPDLLPPLHAQARLGKSQEEVAGKLVYFIRDTYLKAGYSRVMTGHMSKNATISS